MDGWTIKIGELNYNIDKAVIDYIHGEINDEEIISMWPNDKMYISLSNSPIGYSFLVNKCSGYLGQFQEYSPPLIKACPNYSNNIDNECQYLIPSLENCAYPQENEIKSNDNCYIRILDIANYNSCYYANYLSGNNFYGNEWRIFTGSIEELPNSISILDKEKLLIGSIKLDI